MTPTGIPTTVIKAIMMPTGTTTRKTKPTPRFFHGEAEIAVTMASVCFGNRAFMITPTMIKAGMEMIQRMIRKEDRTVFPFCLKALAPSHSALLVLRATSPEIDIERPFKDLKTELVSRFEETYVRRLLESTKGNIAAAARKARIAAAALKRWLAKMGRAPRIKERMMTGYWQFDAEPLESAQYWKDAEAWIRKR